MYEMNRLANSMRAIVAMTALVSSMAACVSNDPTKTADDLVVSAEDVRAVVGPADVVEVRVYREPELSGQFEVSAGGMLRLPLLEPLQVSDMTTEAIAERIEAAYNVELLRNAQVSVFVKEYNSRKIIVTGQVKKPGPVPYRLNMTVAEAVARAGGTTRLAMPEKTIVTREKDGKRERYLVNLRKIERGEARNVELLPNDIVNVPVSPY
jgi:polysaccharide export outer membrane protein